MLTQSVIRKQNIYIILIMQLSIMFFFNLLLFVITPINSFPTDFSNSDDLDSFQDELAFSAEPSSSDNRIAGCISDDSLDDAVEDATSIFRRTERAMCAARPTLKRKKIPSTEEDLNKAPEITTISDPDCLTYKGFPIYVTCSGSEYRFSRTTNIAKIVLNCMREKVPKIPARTPFTETTLLAQYCCQAFVPVSSLF